MLFGKKNKTDNEIIYSPIEGKCIPLKDISDEVFSSGMLGIGCGIIPTRGIVKSPVNGKIIMITDTKHAIGLTDENGVEILIHIGLDTVSLEGDGFETKVKINQKVKVGDTLIEFDLNKIREKGLSEESVLLISNADILKENSIKENISVKAGDELITYTKK